MLRARGRSGPRVWAGSLGTRIGHAVGHNALRVWSLAGRRDRRKGREEASCVGGLVLTLKTQGPGGGRRGERWEQACHVGVGAGDKQVLRQEGW